ncbi:hypothetical protein [Saccharopolyspora sp. 7B]|uniref:hypothetical protein n=1 Tax=Saccharopolyspora sp. 7B TaxID=2877240 RepID=UPI001CD3DCB0|nr:hypothetical protein [Saccharopolyspora sp. 7B]MCA1281005.1 hypothetical protein [Saccharopolyspora sp. 7B]
MKPLLVCVSVGVTSAAVTFSVLAALHAANSLAAPPPRRRTGSGRSASAGSLSAGWGGPEPVRVPVPAR